MHPTTTLALLFQAAETHHHATKSDILGPGRSARLVHIRHALIYTLHRAHPALPDIQLAPYFLRDRSTISYSRLMAARLIETRHRPFLDILAPLTAALPEPDRHALRHALAHIA